LCAILATIELPFCAPSSEKGQHQKGQDDAASAHDNLIEKCSSSIHALNAGRTESSE
jgi:hypothetical protein